jgi:two-component system, sensor histidine kinase
VLTAPAPLFLPAAGAEARALMTMILLVWITAAASVLGVFPPSYKLYSAGALLNIALGWWLSASVTDAAVVSVIMLPLWLLLARFAERVGQLIEQSVNIRHEREVLVKRLEAALAETEAAQSARSRFLAAASHDLLQPVHALLLLSGLSRDLPDGPRRGHVLGQIHLVAESIESMFRGLLDLARFDAGTLQPHLQAVPVEPVLQSLRAAYEARCTDKGLAFEVDSAANACVRADPSMLARVLRNLVDNAVKFTPRGSVAVRCRVDAERVTVEVSDTGVGISSADLPHVRDAFFRGSGAREVEADGVGLGLATSTQMVELLGGTIEIDSRPGQGTTVRLGLPVASQAMPAAPTASALKPLRYRCIALVEDDRSAREATVLWLQERGCRVFAGADAHSVLDQCEQQAATPEFIIADYHLGDAGNGLQAIGRLRERFGAVPAAVVSGEPLGAGVLPPDIPLLPKPLNSEALKQLLQET